MHEQATEIYGYVTQQAEITTFVANGIRPAFLCLDGVGGIGKTTLLRSLHARYCQAADYCTTTILDFDNLRFHIVQNVLEQIVDDIQALASFADFRAASARLHALPNEGASSLRLEDQEAETREAFIAGFAQAAGGMTVVLFFDTVEKIQDMAQWQDLLAVLVQLKNCVVVLAGRRNREVSERLSALLDSRGSVKLTSLEGLDESAALAYFSRTRRGAYLVREDPEQSRWVCELCGGLPILLDLAVDWLSRDAGLSIPAQPAAADKAAALPKLRKSFERGLVEQVMQLSKPDNEAILDMAHVYHYFDAERHCQIHPEFTPDQSLAVLDSLHDFSFVKPQPGGGIRLHDEMQRMVAAYVWPWLDPNKTRRRYISRQMIHFYDQRLPVTTDETLAQTYRVERLYHALYADLEEGHKDFRRLFHEALRSHLRDYARLLLNTLNEFAADFDPALAAWADVHTGRLRREEERVEDAVKLIRPAKQALQQLGVQDGLDTVCNALGFGERLLGNWEQATAAYEEALVYSRQENDARQLAETTNNIANVSRLSGDYERANCYSLLSLKIRENLGDTKGIAASCYVRGMVAWETGNSAEAAGYLQRACQLFTDAGYAEGVAETIKYQSYLHFRTGNLEQALALVRDAKKTFADREIGLQYADCVNQEARILIDLYAADKVADEREMDARFARVEALAEEALKVARRIHDSYKIAECNLTLCRLYYRWGRFYHDRDLARAQTYYDLARMRYVDREGGQLARDRHYHGPESVYEWVMGDVAFVNAEWDTAFDHYMAEAEISCHFKDARYARALNALSDRLHTLAARGDGGRELARRYCDYVSARWQARHLGVEFPEVIEECTYVKESLRLVDPAAISRLRREGEGLLERGAFADAIPAFEKLVEIGQAYRPDETVAYAMNQIARAYRQMGEFVPARRACQQGLLIRQQMAAESGVAASHVVMGTIMWTTGNTSEATRHYRLAQEIYRRTGDQVGLARANRHTAFMVHLIGDWEQAWTLAESAAETFAAHQMEADMADVCNLQAMLLMRNDQLGPALEQAERALHLATRCGAQYTVAEAQLTLMQLAYRLALQQAAGGDTPGTPDFAPARAHFIAGEAVAQLRNYRLLLSVYHGAAGLIAFDEKQHAEALRYFVKDLAYGADYSISRLRRELDKIVNCFVQLPPDLRRVYADYIIDEWRSAGREQAAPDVTRLFQLLKEYDAYV